MVDPTTTNLVLAQPLRASDVGTWDIPVNGNTGIIDQAFGGVTTLALSSASITLTSSQAQNAIIRLTGTLTSNVSITLPSIYKFWTVDNQLVNSPSSFAATLVSTSGASAIGLPPSTQDVFYDGTTVNYRNLDKVGEYWDYAGPTVPTWVTLSTKPPYLNCIGTAFSSATYPILANLLGTTTLPDSRNRFRASLSQGSSRITVAVSGVDGSAFLASGSSQSVTLASSNLPPYTPAGAIVTTCTDAAPATLQFPPQSGFTAALGGSASGGSFNQPPHFQSLFTGTPAPGQVSAPVGILPPTYIGGITMIRAA